MASMVQLKNVTKRFGSFVATHDVSLDIEEGEFLTLLGPSGCGKTTLLRMISGFENADAALDAKLRHAMQIELKHLQRKVGITFVFVTHDQEEALTMSDRIAVINLGRIELSAPERHRGRAG